MSIFVFDMMTSENLISSPPMSSSQVSETQLLQLTERISQKLLQQHPVSSERVSGEAIKSYFPHQQVSSFLLFQIYQVWDQRVQQLKHPYFDFSSDEVSEMLDLLKNRLAHHISVDRESFTNLTDRSVANTLRFILDPENGFRQFFFAQSEELHVDQLDKYSHFFADWDFVVNSILRYCRKHEMETISWNAFSEKMNRVLDIYEQKKGQSILTYRKELYHSLTGESLEDYLRELQKAREAEKEAQKAREEQERRERELEAARKRAAEEQARLEAERKAREEEERRRKEEEAKRKTIFDDLGGSGEALDLDEDLDEQPAESQPEPPHHIPSVGAQESHDPHPPAVEQTFPEDHGAPGKRVGEEKAAESATEVTDSQDDDEFLEMAASMEPDKENVEKKEEEGPKTTYDKLANGTSTFLDRFQAKREDEPADPQPDIPAQPEPEAKTEEQPKTAESPEEGPGSVLDKIQEKSQTVADKFAEHTRQRKLHESINGNQKIKLDDIAIHKQYQYVQKVFNGNNVRFRIIVDRVNDARDANEVEDILNKFVLNIDDLDREDPVVQEFVSLLRNRF